jgi:hypothetical protein
LPPTTAEAETAAITRANASSGVFMGSNTLNGRRTFGNPIFKGIMRGQVGRIIGRLLKAKHLPRHVS